MAMTPRLPPEIEDQLKQVAEVEHRSVQQTVLVAIEEYLSMRETADAWPIQQRIGKWPAELHDVISSLILMRAGILDRRTSRSFLHYDYGIPSGLLCLGKGRSYSSWRMSRPPSLEII